MTGKPALTKIQITQEAERLGFCETRFSEATLPALTAARLDQFLDSNFEGEMTWLRDTRERRIRPDAMWEKAQTAIMLAMNYGPDHDPLETLNRPDIGNISVYARNRDYHDVMKGRLKELGQKISSRNRCEVKVFVDTAPLMEKPLAGQAGIGWQGKHTNLVSTRHGSWLFLGAILTDQVFDTDDGETDHCGSCRACLDICPTNAFPAPYQLDARRCISYLTIEHSAPIPAKFRKAMGNRIYGCDDCLAACPWNKFASAASEAKFKARDELNDPHLADLLKLDDRAFRDLFSGSPVKRIGRDRFVRNVLIAAGNSGNTDLCNVVRENLADANPLVRGAGVWALLQLLDDEAFQDERKRHIKAETDQSVLQEWNYTNKTETEA